MGLAELEHCLASWGRGDGRRGEANLCGRTVGEGETMSTEGEGGERCSEWGSEGEGREGAQASQPHLFPEWQHSSREDLAGRGLAVGGARRVQSPVPDP